MRTARKLLLGCGTTVEVYGGKDFKPTASRPARKVSCPDKPAVRSATAKDLVGLRAA